jgi:hypothetical protein
MTTNWWWIGNELVGTGSGVILRKYPGISLEVLRKITIILSQDRRFPGPKKSNPGPPEYKVVMLTARIRRSIDWLIIMRWDYVSELLPLWLSILLIQNVQLYSPNVVIEWLTLLLRILEVSDSNLNPETGYSDWHVSWFSLVPPS